MTPTQSLRAAPGGAAARRGWSLGRPPRVVEQRQAEALAIQLLDLGTLGRLATLVGVEQVLAGEHQERGGIEAIASGFATPCFDVSKNCRARFEEFDGALEVGFDGLISAWTFAIRTFGFEVLKQRVGVASAGPFCVAHSTSTRARSRRFDPIIVL